MKDKRKLRHRLGVALPPCATTRCFIEAIHPKQYETDLLTVRFQARKSPGVNWDDAAFILATTNWYGVFKERAMSHKQGQTLVASFRLRFQ